jgi:hypothetical protein
MATNVRGVRSQVQSNPQQGGYLLGRLDDSPGNAEQISFSDISRLLRGAKKYAISFSYVGGVLANSQLLGLHAFSRAITFPADFAAYGDNASQAGGTANATGSTAIVVQQNGSNVGTITIGAGGITPTFSTSGAAVAFAAGDVLKLVGPSTADATFANFYCTLVGYES